MQHKKKNTAVVRTSFTVDTSEAGGASARVPCDEVGAGGSIRAGRRQAGVYFCKHRRHTVSHEDYMFMYRNMALHCVNIEMQ